MANRLDSFFRKHVVAPLSPSRARNNSGVVIRVNSYLSDDTETPTSDITSNPSELAVTSRSTSPMPTMLEEFPAGARAHSQRPSVVEIFLSSDTSNKAFTAWDITRDLSLLCFLPIILTLLTYATVRIYKECDGVEKNWWYMSVVFVMCCLYVFPLCIQYMQLILGVNIPHVVGTALGSLACFVSTTTNAAISAWWYFPAPFNTLVSVVPGVLVFHVALPYYLVKHKNLPLDRSLIFSQIECMLWLVEFLMGLFFFDIFGHANSGVAQVFVSIAATIVFRFWAMFSEVFTQFKSVKAYPNAPHLMPMFLNLFPQLFRALVVPKIHSVGTFAALLAIDVLSIPLTHSHILFGWSIWERVFPMKRKFKDLQDEQFHYTYSMFVLRWCRLVTPVYFIAIYLMMQRGVNAGTWVLKVDTDEDFNRNIIFAIIQFASQFAACVILFGYMYWKRNINVIRVGHEFIRRHGSYIFQQCCFVPYLIVKFLLRISNAQFSNVILPGFECP